MADRDFEKETIIRWDESGNEAVLWTASGAVAREWKSFNFPVEKDGANWSCRVPIDRVSYKPMKASKSEK